jgi:hypothetical protein
VPVAFGRRFSWDNLFEVELDVTLILFHSPQDCGYVLSHNRKHGAEFIAFFYQRMDETLWVGWGTSWDNRLAEATG